MPTDAIAQDIGLVLWRFTPPSEAVLWNTYHSATFSFIYYTSHAAAPSNPLLNTYPKPCQNIGKDRLIFGIRTIPTLGVYQYQKCFDQGQIMECGSSTAGADPGIFKRVYALLQNIWLRPPCRSFTYTIGV